MGRYNEQARWTFWDVSDFAEWLDAHGPDYAEAYSEATFACHMYDGPVRGHGSARSVLGWLDGCLQQLAEDEAIRAMFEEATYS